jgi:hypothetical protein
MEMPMQRADAPATPPTDTPDGRNRLEIIRFASADAQRQAIGVLMERGMLNFTSYCEEEWLVSTAVARQLRALGVPFVWLTEHA